MQITGDYVVMNKTNPRHFGPTVREPGAQDFIDAFKNNTMSALKNVNGNQVESDRLVTKMITRPDSVDVHNVMIAQQKAQLSLDLTRTVLNRAIQAYKGITSLR